MPTRPERRLLWPIALVVASFVVTAAAFPAYASWTERFHGEKPSVAAPVVVDESEPHTHGTDATSKNALSQSSAAGTAEAQETTTINQRLSGNGSVVAQRQEADPRLVPAASPAPRATVPADRYAMAGGCYALRAPSGRWLATAPGGRYAATTTDAARAAPLWFQATDLGVYLLYGTRRTVIDSGLLGVADAGRPRPSSEWTVEQRDGGFTFVQGGKGLVVGAGGSLTRATTPDVFTLRTTSGCAEYPEIDVNVQGAPFTGASPFQEVRGYIDGHTHGMAFEFLGGSVHCGRPWHKYGVAYALRDCPDHSLTAGAGALLENALKGGLPVGLHDTVGWPTFTDWPAPDSLTHEGTYYKWIERSWRGGQRILVNLFVENNQLCQVYPLKRNSCDDMESIRLQAKDIRDLERYIDAQNGGPGKGWFRIVTSPWEARRVINSGQLAVVLGIETSVPFGCSTNLDRPECSAQQIDQQLDEVHDLGVRQMELVNKFDNALAGVAGDTGTVAPLINAANFLETGSFWDMRTCKDPQTEDHDNAQITLPTVVPEQDALFGAIASLYLPLKLPLYASGPHCNDRGLTTLGDHTITQLAERGMIFDPDHMSVKARQQALDVTERLGHSGVVSSHSWSTPDAYERIYRAGGTITAYAGDSEGFVEKWRKHLTWADPRYYFGFGYGADINGLGAQGSPRGADAENPVTYPFRGLGGVTIDRQVSGERTYDVNVDGVAHYGLYPDWIEDLRRQGGDAIVDDLSRGAEAYLQTWERAEGVSNDGCRDARAIKRDSTIAKAARKGATVEQVLRGAGQPHTRLGQVFSYCAKTAKGKRTTVKVSFSAAGKVVRTMT